MIRVQVYEGEGKEPAIKQDWQAGRFNTHETEPGQFRIELFDPTADTLVKIDEAKRSSTPIDVTVNKMYVGRRRLERVHYSYGDRSAAKRYTRKITIYWIEV